MFEKIIEEVLEEFAKPFNKEVNEGLPYMDGRDFTPTDISEFSKAISDKIGCEVVAEGKVIMANGYYYVSPQNAKDIEATLKNCLNFIDIDCKKYLGKPVEILIKVKEQQL